MSQLALFDEPKSEAEKIAGIDAAAGNKAETLKYARTLAVNLARQRGAITADDVVEAMVRHGFDVHCLGNAAGSLFRGGDWEFTGEFRKSDRVHAHKNLLRLWKLKD